MGDGSTYLAGRGREGPLLEEVEGLTSSEHFVYDPKTEFDLSAKENELSRERYGDDLDGEEKEERNGRRKR
jgi:hypothetical protein